MLGKSSQPCQNEKDKLYPKKYCSVGSQEIFLKSVNYQNFLSDNRGDFAVNLYAINFPSLRLSSSGNGSPRLEMQEMIVYWHLKFHLLA